MAGRLHGEKAEPSLKRALWGKLKNAENKCLLYRMCRPQSAVLVNKWWRGRGICPAELVSFGQLCVCVGVCVCMQSWQDNWPSWVYTQALFMSMSTFYVERNNFPTLAKIKDLFTEQILLSILKESIVWAYFTCCLCVTVTCIKEACCCTQAVLTFLHETFTFWCLEIKSRKPTPNALVGLGGIPLGCPLGMPPFRDAPSNTISPPFNTNLGFWVMVFVRFCV